MCTCYRPWHAVIPPPPCPLHGGCSGHWTWTPCVHPRTPFWPTTTTIIYSSGT